jgi:ATP-dependent helicase/nuclease subunit B
LFKKDDARQDVVEGALIGLTKLIDEYDRPDQPYLAHPHPTWAPRFSDYTILARVAEWSLTGDDKETDAILGQANG